MADIATPGTFITNFEPLTPKAASALVDQVAEFDLFTDWYKKRLEVKQRSDIALWERHERAIERSRTLSVPFDVGARRVMVREQLARVRSPEYLKELRGTIGADPSYLQIRGR